MTDVNAVRWIPVQGDGRILCVAFRSDSRHVVGGYSSGYIRQWNVDSGDEYIPSSMKSGGDVCALATSIDGRWIVSGDRSNRVIVWNAVTHQKAIEVSEHTGYVCAVDVSSDSTRMASGSYDSTVRVFDIVSGTKLIPLLRHISHVLGVKFSPDGAQIATSEIQGSVNIYDARSGNKLFDFSNPSFTSPPITPLAWSFNGRKLFVATTNKIISFDQSTFYRSEWQDQSTSISSIAAHGHLVACCQGSSILFWDYSSRKEIGRVNESRGSNRSRGPFNRISMSHDGKYIVYGSDLGIEVRNLVDLLPKAHFIAPPIESRIQLIQMSDIVFNSWKQGNQAETESILSAEIARYSSHSHHALAGRSLIRSHMDKWETAIEDAELSLEIEQSPIGQIAKCTALIGLGKQEDALDDFDLVFREADSNDNILLLVIKYILMFMCGKPLQAISRLHGLITASNRDHYSLVLVNMYLKQGDYRNAVKTLELMKKPSVSNSLKIISFIFNWDFDSLAATAWKTHCRTLYTSGCIEELGETLEKMTSPLAENEKEPAHGHILQELVARTGEVTLLAWTGESSACNSCLPSSPIVYGKRPFVPPYLEGDELTKRINELRSTVLPDNAIMIYGRATRLQPVRFIHFRLHLPCIIFSITSLKVEQENIYRAETVELGDVQFTTADSLPLKHPWRLVFADLRIHGLQKPRCVAVSRDDTASSDTETLVDLGITAVKDAGNVDAPIIEEVSPTPPDTYTRALELIARLGQPFSALLLLQQPDGVYRRVAADYEIVIGGMGNHVPEDIRVEVLEIL